VFASAEIGAIAITKPHSVVKERGMARPYAVLIAIAGVVSGSCLACSPATPATDTSLSSTAIRLDDARRSIQPGLGANEFAVTRPFIDNVPQGENAPLHQVLRRTPNARQAGQ
jgi:hypothetical protein